MLVERIISKLEVVPNPLGFADDKVLLSTNWNNTQKWGLKYWGVVQKQNDNMNMEKTKIYTNNLENGTSEITLS